jgi:hypothetical protein
LSQRVQVLEGYVLFCSKPFDLHLSEQIRVFFGQKQLVTISQLFHWSAEAGWKQFWTQGVKNYKDEMLFYELLSRLEREGVEREASQVPSDAREAPIVIDA